MTKLEFDDDFSNLMEEFNVSRGAVNRRKHILEELGLKPGMRVLDVGSGLGHQVYEIAQALHAGGQVEGLDSTESYVDIGRLRCAGLSNAKFTLGDAYKLPYDTAEFDVAMSSQVFEYLDDVPKALAEIYRVVRPGGRALIHGTGWGALLWHSKDPQRMANILEVWDGHLADPRMCETLAGRLRQAGFTGVEAHPLVQVETEFDSSNLSAVLSKFMVGYLTSQDMPSDVADAWAEEHIELGAVGDYFFSANEYIFTGTRP